MAELYKSIADEIWENPELSFKEYKAAGLYCKVLAATAIDLIENDELLQKAKAEFEKRSAGGYVCPIEAGAKPIAL